jgi:hypothetical protein
MNNVDSFVLQAPSLNSICHKLDDWLDDSVKFIWVERDSDEIRQSRKRVDWQGEQRETIKYFEFADMLSRFDIKDSVDRAKVVFYEYQRHRIDVEVVNYHDFDNHELWKDEREALGIGDT